MMFAREEALAIDNPMSGDGLFCVVAGIHGPADHASGKAGAETGGDGAIGSDTAAGDLACDLVHQLEKIVLFFAGGGESG